MKLKVFNKVPSKLKNFFTLSAVIFYLPIFIIIPLIFWNNSSITLYITLFFVLFSLIFCFGDRILLFLFYPKLEPCNTGRELQQLLRHISFTFNLTCPKLYIINFNSVHSIYVRSFFSPGIIFLNRSFIEKLEDDEKRLFMNCCLYPQNRLNMAINTLTAIVNYLLYLSFSTLVQRPLAHFYNTDKQVKKNFVYNMPTSYLLIIPFIELNNKLFRRGRKARMKWYNQLPDSIKTNFESLLKRMNFEMTLSNRILTNIFSPVFPV